MSIDRHFCSVSKLVFILLLEKPKDNMAQFNILQMENERLQRELMLLQEQNALAQNRRQSDKEGNYPSHSRSRDHDNNRVKRRNSIPDRYTNKPNTGSQGGGKSNKTVSLVPDEELIEEIDNISTRSYYSEPAERPRERVVYYKAYHHPNGGFHIEKVPEKDPGHDERPANRNEVTKRSLKVPPLDLRDVSSPTGQPYGTAYKQQQKKFLRFGDKENHKRPNNDNFRKQPNYHNLGPNLFSNWDNCPVVQQAHSTHNPQFPRSKHALNPGLSNSKSFTEPSRSKPGTEKPSIMGFHGLIDPNEYTFYSEPSKHVELPGYHRNRKVSSPKLYKPASSLKLYKPTVKPGLPKTQMSRDNYNENSNDIDEGPNPDNTYYFQENGNDQYPQETEHHQAGTVNADPVQKYLPDDNNVSQQQLPSNLTDNENDDDDDELEYTPGGSPILEESEDDVSLGLPHYEREDYYQPYKD